MIKETKKALHVKGLPEETIDKYIDDLAKYLIEKAYKAGDEDRIESVRKDRARRQRLMKVDFDDFYERYCKDVSVKMMFNFEETYFNWAQMTHYEITENEEG